MPVTADERKKKSLCFTKKSKTLTNILTSDVPICSTSKKVLKESALAIWDTGANRTCIDEGLAEELKLPIVKYERQATANGVRNAPVYRISLLLPNNIFMRNIFVGGGKLGGIDLLIGMDIICKGDFAISNYRGKTTFTFRIPSVQETDYVSERLKNLR